MKILIMLSISCFVTGILFGFISAGKNYFNSFLVYLKSIQTGLVSRLDKALTGNDGAYSHTRMNNLLWGIGGFILICVAVLRSIRIQPEVIVLIGAGMGISGLQAVVNKMSELKFASSQAPVNSGVSDDTSVQPSEK